MGNAGHSKQLAVILLLVPYSTFLTLLCCPSSLGEIPGVDLTLEWAGMLCKYDYFLVHPTVLFCWTLLRLLRSAVHAPVPLSNTILWVSEGRITGRQMSCTQVADRSRVGF
ncbi:hypothetical protein F4859DRAFT_498168 [Xylaria cf. heliscus]|nr:hypothetical protein F4859DRAFT_498168 [Xylaria cf. heliscus]